MAQKIVLVGAGSAQFGVGTIGDIFSSKILAGSEICLHDNNPETMESVREQAEKFRLSHQLDFTITATTDRKRAFKNADFIIISIEVGDRFKLWDEDWKIPQQYGIHQVYGENGGPGGVFHALRIIPPILDICGDAQTICPDSHLFCYSNPMTAITTAVHRAYPGIKFTGLCHEIASLERYLPKIMDRKFEDMELTAAGLNHFSCVVEAKDKKTGKNIYPEIMKKAYEFFATEPGYSDVFEKYKQTGKVMWTEGAKSRAQLGIENSAFDWADRKLFKFVMENYNLLPITVDSHFGEYLSWAWEVADHQGIVDFYDFYRIALGQENRPEISLEVHERVVAIMEGIVTNSGYLESAVNIPNNGYINDLPSWIAVEVPATVSKAGLVGKKIGDLPKGYLALLRNYVGVYDLTAEAVLHKSKDFVIQALLANPVVNRALPIREMVDRMIRQQSRWLGYLK
ncbi:MAG: alpha-glucosidase [Spirochaetales bacterium]|nr:alpha-glucosidase [Spirochaetales bacterium]